MTSKSIQKIVNEFIKENHLSNKEAVIAFSGGADSLVLLDTIKKSNLFNKITIAHVNHNINENSKEWEAKCRDVALEYEVKFVSKNIYHNGNENLENWARKERYNFFDELMNEESVLFTGHHLNDQAETVLMKLFRGGGIEGLCGIYPIKLLKKGLMARPLLGINKREIYDYMEFDCNVAEWIEDPSNKDSSYDRNFLRNEVIPLIESRWPDALSNIGKSTKILSSHQKIMNSFIEKEYNEVVCNETYKKYGLKPLLVRELLDLDEEKQKLIIKKWVNDQGYQVNGMILKELVNNVAMSENIGSKIMCKNFYITKDLLPKKEFNLKREKIKCIYLVPNNFSVDLEKTKEEKALLKEMHIPVFFKIG